VLPTYQSEFKELEEIFHEEPELVTRTIKERKNFKKEIQETVQMAIHW
jgi:hypothetical protein